MPALDGVRVLGLGLRVRVRVKVRVRVRVEVRSDWFGVGVKGQCVSDILVWLKPG